MKKMFDHYTATEVTPEDTAVVTLYSLEGEPELTVRPAGEVNKPYFNELLRRNQKLARTLRGRAIDVSIMAKTRDSDRELYAKFILTGWNKVVDGDKNPVEFSEENASGFLHALPAEEFDEVRAFCTNTYNFTESDIEDAGEVAGNSQSA